MAHIDRKGGTREHPPET